MDGRPLRNAVEHWVAQLSKPDSERDENAFAGFLLAVFQAHIGIYEELAAIRRALEHVPTHEEHRP